MDNKWTAIIGLLTLALVVIFVAANWTPKNLPRRIVAPPASSDAGTQRKVNVVPGASLLGAPSVSAMQKRKVIREKPVRKLDASAPSLLTTLQPEDGGVITDDTQLQQALEELDRGIWPTDVWTRRKAMLLVIHTLRFDLPPKWPGSKKPDDLVKDVFIVTLQTHELAPLADKLVPTYPAPVPSATR